VQPAQVGDVGDLDQPPGAQDRDPVAHGLDLGELVGAEEHRAAAVPGLPHAGAELLLHERVQAARRLVQDQHRSPGGERRDQGHLLPVAGGVGPPRSRRIQLEALHQLVAVGEVGARADPGEQLEGLGTGQRRPERDVGGHVGEVRVGGRDVGGRGAEHPGPA
jgi:hypothetical protein